MVKEEGKAEVIDKAGRFHNMNEATIISSTYFDNVNIQLSKLYTA